MVILKENMNKQNYFPVKILIIRFVNNRNLTDYTYICNLKAEKF